MRRLKLAAIGCGGRTETYLGLAARMPEYYEVVAAADTTKVAPKPDTTTKGIDYSRYIFKEDEAAKTAESGAMSKELMKRGFKFVGSTICYAFMQAVGMVNDHVVDCFRYQEVQAIQRKG